MERVADGVSPRAKTAVGTLETILSYTAEEPTWIGPRTTLTPPGGCGTGKPYPFRPDPELRTIEVEPSGDARSGLARVAHAPRQPLRLQTDHRDVVTVSLVRTLCSYPLLQRRSGADHANVRSALHRFGGTPKPPVSQSRSAISKPPASLFARPRRVS